jgi:hypothetical protein
MKRLGHIANDQWCEAEQYKYREVRDQHVAQVVGCQIGASKVPRYERREDEAGNSAKELSKRQHARIERHSACRQAAPPYHMRETGI